MIRIQRLTNFLISSHSITFPYLSLLSSQITSSIPLIDQSTWIQVAVVYLSILMNKSNLFSSQYFFVVYLLSLFSCLLPFFLSLLFFPAGLFSFRLIVTDLNEHKKYELLTLFTHSQSFGSSLTHIYMFFCLTMCPFKNISELCVALYENAVSSRSDPLSAWFSRRRERESRGGSWLLFTVIE